MNIEVLKSKTVLAAIVSLATSAAGVYLGDATAWQGVQAGVLALVAIFMRAALGGVADKAAAAAAAAQAAAEGVTAQAKDAQDRRQPKEAARAAMPAAGEQ